MKKIEKRLNYYAKWFFSYLLVHYINSSEEFVHNMTISFDST